MELPKNITQIGETNPHCKIYVEDYVVSYMKQMNAMAVNKDMAVALYGTRREEGLVTYLFLYGACKVDFLQRETRHLSQAQQQEIERKRKKYFMDYQFLGYRLLNGEMIEGVHVCEQGICRYILGYAQFYEKNDCMLNFMLDVREEIAPEMVSREKYDIVRERQEERRAIYEEQTASKQVPPASAGHMRKMKGVAAAVFVMLGAVGLASLSGDGGVERIKESAEQLMSSVMEQQLPDAIEAGSSQVKVDMLVAEDNLASAVLQENEELLSMESVATESVVVESVETEQTPSESVKETGVPSESDVPENASAEEVTAEPTSYTICPGDTLIGICVREYGSDARLSEVCELNRIANADEIEVGQKILLP